MSEDYDYRLSAFFDQELDASSADSCRKAVDGDPALAAELNDFQSVQQSVRGWYREMSNEVGQREVSLWSKLAPEVQRIAKQTSEQFVSKPRKVLFWKDWFDFSQFSQLRWSRQLGGAVALAATCVVILSVYLGDVEENFTQPEKIVFRGFPNEDKKSNSLMLNVSSRSPLLISEAIKKDYLRQIVTTHQTSARSVGSGLHNVVGENFVLGGLRADALDIEGIRSAHRVSFHAAEGRDRPPVIWVSRGR